jgi:hypothetical protein
MDDELRDTALRTFEPPADFLVDIRTAGTVRSQNVGVIVCDDSRTVAPGRLVVFEGRLNARDVNRKLSGATEGEGGVLLKVPVDVEVKATHCRSIVRDVEVDRSPLLNSGLGLYMLECRLEKDHGSENV